MHISRKFPTDSISTSIWFAWSFRENCMTYACCKLLHISRQLRFFFPISWLRCMNNFKIKDGLRCHREDFGRFCLPMLFPNIAVVSEHLDSSLIASAYWKSSGTKWLLKKTVSWEHEICGHENVKEITETRQTWKKNLLFFASTESNEADTSAEHTASAGTVIMRLANSSDVHCFYVASDVLQRRNINCQCD